MNCTVTKTKNLYMKNILIFAGIAGIAAAVAIYFTTESFKKIDEDDSDYVSDADIFNYDLRENTGRPQTV